MENNRGFKAHDACSDHLLSMTRWGSCKIQKKNPGANIRNMLDPERQSLVENNREYMKTLLEYHRYFCSEEMAYRGHDETDESLNPGKWKEFINVMLRTNPTFEQLHRRVIQTYKARTTTHKAIFARVDKSHGFRGSTSDRGTDRQSGDVFNAHR